MRLILVILILFSGTVLSRYYEKRRFDRSVYDDFKTLNTSKHLVKKQWTFTDYQMYFRAYKDRIKNNCYIEKLEDNVEEKVSKNKNHQQELTSKILYAPNEFLSKLEAWQIVGGRIVDFCRGRKIILLENTIPMLNQKIDPIFNILPLDENDIVARRIGEVILTPLISRTKRQVILEERQKLNGNLRKNRLRRQVQQSPGKFRGQTQSQYLNIGNNDQEEGKAEAEATQQSSRAVVSGSHGMGQAQSMSLGDIGCEDCPKYNNEGAPDRYIKFSGADHGGISVPQAGSKILEIKQPADATIHSSMITPGMDRTYSGRVPDSTIRGHMPYSSDIHGIKTNGRVVYPVGIPGATTGGSIQYPGDIPGATTDGSIQYPGGIPGATTGGSIQYPGRIPGATTGGSIQYSGGIPGATTGGSIQYPGGIPGATTGGSIQYPGGIPSATSGGSIQYPGDIPGATTDGSIQYPGGIPGATTGGSIQYPGGIPGATTGGSIQYPGGIPGTTTGGSIQYPGRIPGATTGGSIQYSGGIPGATTGGSIQYPGGIPGTMIGKNVPYPISVTTTPTGGKIVYPGGIPGTRTDSSTIYPGSIPSTTGTVTGGNIPSTTSGGRVVYSGGIPVTAASDGTIYSGGVPGTSTGGSIPYPKHLPGTVSRENVPYPGSRSSITTDGRIVYSGGMPTTGSGITYPGGMPGTIIRNGPVYPDSTQSSLTSDQLGAYPGGVLPDTRKSVIGSKPTTNGRIYSNEQIPTTQFFDERLYPTGRGNIIKENTYHNIGSQHLPAANQLEETGTIPGTPVTFSGSGPTYLEGTIPTTTGHFITDDHRRYPTASNINSDGTKIQIGADNTHLQNMGTDQTRISYPQDIIKYPDGRMIQIPETVKYPENYAVIPPEYPLQGQYSNTGTWQDRKVPASDISREPVLMSVNGQGIKQYPNDRQNIRQQYSGIQYPSNIGPVTNAGEVSQYYQERGVSSTIEDNSNSQASSSVKQTDSGTQASASAQGKFGQGTTQSQVTGTYSGSGSFSAQAGSTDVNKSTQTEINGGKEGAVSNAQGVGGYGKSQAQVQLNSESGATTTGAQSSGLNHGTNSQVQASSKGGMADAQASGEGSTSSQAQIGFHPYIKTDEKAEKHSSPFHGGGAASAQSGAYTGQSQSQLEGSFQYGITYTGAAQAGSGSGAAASRKPFNFNFTDTDLFKSFKPSYIPQIVQRNNSEANMSSDMDYEYNQNKPLHGLQTSSTSRRRVIIKPVESSQSIANKPNQTVEKSQMDDTIYDYEEEYDDEDYDASPVQTAMDSKISKIYSTGQNDSDHQLQTVHVETGNQYNIHMKQDANTAQVGDMLQPGQSLLGYTIPAGFRGRVTSVAGDETFAHGNGKSQSQTISLVPKGSSIRYKNKSPISEIRSLKTNHEKSKEGHTLIKDSVPQIPNQQTSTEYIKPPPNISIKPSYYTVTNSVAGKMDGRNSPRRYEHRYYTKSSTCGYFTFSCDVVYGSNGRTKICKPKMPTYPDGTPMKC